MYSIALASDLVRDVATVRPPLIDFRTVGDKPDEIASDFTRLYVSLHNEGRIPLKSYQVNSFSGIEDVFRSNQLFHGSPFPIELDSIACDVNPDVCTRERTEATPEEQKSGAYIRDVIPDPKRPSGKSRPSSGKWSVAPSTSLWLPSVRVEQQQGWVAYRKSAGQEISEIVIASLELAIGSTTSAENSYSEGTVIGKRDSRVITRAWSCCRRHPLARGISTSRPLQRKAWAMQ